MAALLSLQRQHEFPARNSAARLRSQRLVPSFRALPVKGAAFRRRNRKKVPACINACREMQGISLRIPASSRLRTPPFSKEFFGRRGRASCDPFYFLQIFSPIKFFGARHGATPVGSWAYGRGWSNRPYVGSVLPWRCSVHPLSVASLRVGCVRSANLRDRAPAVCAQSLSSKSAKPRRLKNQALTAVCQPAFTGWKRRCGLCFQALPCVRSTEAIEHG